MTLSLYKVTDFRVSNYVFKQNICSFSVQIFLDVVIDDDDVMMTDDDD